VQSYWYLGGPGTLRGFGGNATRGEAFWRARVELANQWPAARIVAYTDIARAGPRERLSLQQSLIGAGVGASFLDGLIRIDVSRAIRTRAPADAKRPGWRIDFYTDAAL
jgi:hemolysin activation/secretion protein